jgi:cytochrome b pre-mRNA-processing protein 3
MITLHLSLLLLRLKAEGPAATDLGQALFDTLFADMDRSLREMGVGDLGVGKRVKEMGKAVYGRLAAYEAGLAGAPGELEAALVRNLYGTVTPDQAGVAQIAAYMQAATATLAGQAYAGIAAGAVTWPSLETAKSR